MFSLDSLGTTMIVLGFGLLGFNFGRWLKLRFSSFTSQLREELDQVGSPYYRVSRWEDTAAAGSFRAWQIELGKHGIAWNRTGTDMVAGPVVRVWFAERWMYQEPEQQDLSGQLTGIRRRAQMYYRTKVLPYRRTSPIEVV